MPSIILLIELAIIVFIIASFWKVFAKAGQPGWACIIPIYSAYVFMKIAGRPGWWLILLFIPVVGVVIGIIACIDVAKAFGKGGGFGVGLAFLPFIFGPILGFGDAAYVRGGSAPAPAAA